MGLMIEENSESRELETLHVIADEKKPNSRELTTAEAKTDEIARASLEETEYPHSYDKLNPADITEVPPVAPKVDEAAKGAGIGEDKKSEPNLTLEMLMAGLAYEKKGMGQLAGQEQKTKASLENIDSLLDLSSALTLAGDKDSIELSPDSLAILDKLRSQGIKLLEKGVTKLNKEDLIRLRSDANAQVDKLRTSVQQNFTKIQTIIQFMNSVNDTSKRIANEDSRSKNKFIENQRVR